MPGSARIPESGMVTRKRRSLPRQPGQDGRVGGGRSALLEGARRDAGAARDIRDAGSGLAVVSEPLKRTSDVAQESGGFSDRSPSRVMSPAKKIVIAPSTWSQAIEESDSDDPEQVIPPDTEHRSAPLTVASKSSLAEDQIVSTNDIEAPTSTSYDMSTSSVFAESTGVDMRNQADTGNSAEDAIAQPVPPSATAAVSVDYGDDETDLPGLVPGGRARLLSIDSSVAHKSEHIVPETAQKDTRRGEADSDLASSTEARGVKDFENFATSHYGLYPNERCWSCAEVERLESVESMLMAPVPEGVLALCQLRRMRKARVVQRDSFPTFSLELEGIYDEENKQFTESPRILAYAKRLRKGTKYSYLIGSSLENLQHGRTLGKVNCAFNKTTYSIFDGGFNPKKGPRPGGPTKERKEIARVKYTSGRLRHNGPRELLVQVPAYEGGIRSLQDDGVVHLVNRLPKYDKETRQHTLKFYKRASLSSVKNFILVRDGAQHQDDPATLLHGKRGKNEFSLDVRYPLTIFQAMGIALCSFENSALEGV